MEVGSRLETRASISFCREGQWLQQSSTLSSGNHIGKNSPREEEFWEYSSVEVFVVNFYAEFCLLSNSFPQ